MNMLQAYLICILTAIALEYADGFTNPAISRRFRIQNDKFVSSSSSSSSLQAFGLDTLKRILDPSSSDPTITEEQVRDLFTKWNNALLTGDSSIVANCYSSDPILLPTVSDIPRTDYKGIQDYFDLFLGLQPCGKILEGKITCGPGWATDAGIYEFTLGVDGRTIKARYSFVYTFEQGEWKISQHHSSAMPESKKTTKTLTETEVQSLFSLWSDALETGDPDAVARRYAKDAVLLPTVSDIPRTDYEGIKDYFVRFLALEPKGEIVESHVMCGDNWCEDVGIYDFTLGTTGEVVRARYSFVYTYEDGEWKIAHHHSSRMPEGSVHKLTDDQVRSLFDTWNDALISLDPDQVTKLYSKNAVLLPTVSDQPRYTYDAIRDYFVRFQSQYPEGKILESHVTTGDNWCKNVGIYQFRMALTGEVIMARFSFVYVYENGEWKISHHHSSVMPEAFLDAAKRLKKLEAQMPELTARFNHTRTRFSP